MPVTAQTIAHMQRMVIDLEALTGAHRKELLSAYVNAWDTVVGQLTDALTQLATEPITAARVQRSSRVASALQAIADQLDSLASLTGVVISDGAGHAVSVAAEAQAAIVGSQLPSVGVHLVDVNPDIVGTIVNRTAGQITARSRPLADAGQTAVRQALIRGAAAADNPVKVARDMVRLAEQGFVDLPLWRAEAISRTELNDAARQVAQAWGEANSATLQGWEWLSSRSSNTCAACFAMDGTQHDLSEPGPYGHVNCLLPGAMVSGPLAQASSTRWFDGEVVELELRGGNLLAVTPNHPVLTPHGWVAAGELREGDHVLTGSGADRPTFQRDPDDYQVPARIEDVAESIGRSSGVMTVRMPTAAEDFHGDGAGSHVHVVRTHGLLGDHFQPSGREFGRELDLMLRGVGLSGLTSQGGLRQLLRRARPTSYRSVRRPGVRPVLLRRPCGHQQPVRVGHAPLVNSRVFEHALHESPGGSEILGQQQHGVPGQVSLDYPMPLSEDLATFAGTVSHGVVLRVTRRQWSGHVYNLQTETGWYLANRILTHNCRCTRMPVTKSWASLGIDLPEPDGLNRPPAEDFFRSMSKADQLQIMGPARLQALNDGAAWDSLATLKPNADWRPSWQITPVRDLQVA